MESSKTLLHGVSTHAMDIELPTSDIEHNVLCKDHVNNEHKTRMRHLEIELKKKTRRKKFKCLVCDYTAKTQRGFDRHNNSKAHKFKTKKTHVCIKCNICNSKAMSDLKKCPQCNYESDSIKVLKLHMNIHNKGTPFKCTFCEYAAQNVKDLIDHYKKVKKFSCKIGCSFVAHIEEHLIQHKKTCRW